MPVHSKLSTFFNFFGGHQLPRSLAGKSDYEDDDDDKNIIDAIVTVMKIIIMARMIIIIVRMMIKMMTMRGPSRFQEFVCRSAGTGCSGSSHPLFLVNIMIMIIVMTMFFTSCYLMVFKLSFLLFQKG